MLGMGLGLERVIDLFVGMVSWLVVETRIVDVVGDDDDVWWNWWAFVMLGWWWLYSWYSLESPVLVPFAGTRVKWLWFYFIWIFPYSTQLNLFNSVWRHGSFLLLNKFIFHKARFRIEFWKYFLWRSKLFFRNCVVFILQLVLGYVYWKLEDTWLMKKKKEEWMKTKSVLTSLDFNCIGMKVP